MRLRLLGILGLCAGSAIAGPSAPRAVREGAQPATRHDFRSSERPGSTERSGRLLVKLKPNNTAARTRALTRIAPFAMAEPETDVWSLRLPKGYTEERYADELVASGAVEWAEPDWRLWPAAIPNDPSFAQQYQHQPGAMNTVGAWNMVRGDPSITIAVIDTGVDKNHPDLTGLLPGYNAIDGLTEAQGGDVSPANGHGTWVMGAVGARGNNGVGVTGAGWGFGLLPVRTSNQQDGSALTSEIVAAVTWAGDHGADIVSVSYDGSSAQAVGDLGDALRAKGVLLVWAAGNSGAPFVTQDWPNVVIAGATTALNKLWGSSNYGPGVDLVAPGASILTTSPNNAYAAPSGTSFAAPLVAGVLGLVWSADPSLTADQVEQVLKSTATDLGPAGRDEQFGWGLVNAQAAVASVFTGTVRLPVPFTEPMDQALDPVAWPGRAGTSISSAAPEEPSGSASLRLEPGAELMSARIQASQAAGQSLRWYESSPGHAGLLIEYTDASGVWRELHRAQGLAFESARFGWHAATLPADALHDDLRLRFTVPSWSEPVYVDALSIGSPAAIDPPWRESFDAVAGSPAITPLGGASLVTGSPSASGSGVLRLPDGSSAESKKIQTLVKWGLAGVTDARLGLWARPITGAGALIVEAELFAGVWSPVGTIDAATLDPGRMTRWEIPLPSTMLVPGDARLRVRAQGGGFDVDDLFVTRGSPPPATVCPADLNLDGLADAADLAAFVGMYLAGEAGADRDESGIVDAQDAALFIEVFLQGCGP